MSDTVTLPSSPSATNVDQTRRDHLHRAIEKTGNLLPISGPITSFAFLNTLQELEHLPFDEGLIKGARLFGAEPYLSEERYRAKLGYGRIREADLEAVLRADLGERADILVGSIGTRFDDRRRSWRRPGWPAHERPEVPLCELGTRFDLCMAMLRYPLRQAPLDEQRWFIAETDALTRLRSETPEAVRGKFLDETKHWIMATCAMAFVGPTP